MGHCVGAPTLRCCGTWDKGWIAEYSDIGDQGAVMKPRATVSQIHSPARTVSIGPFSGTSTTDVRRVNTHRMDTTMVSASAFHRQRRIYTRAAVDQLRIHVDANAAKKWFHADDIGFWRCERQHARQAAEADTEDMSTCLGDSSADFVRTDAAGIL